ncbi:MAG: hypothetical protein J6J97_09580, partial [Akkermansia sp.]|nr:hypothetical protein [Akkermansia sp.]
MKFHLPKKLLVAVLATLSVQTTLAGYYTIAEVIGSNENTTMTKSDFPTTKTDCFTAPVAKDGSGTLTVTDEIERNLDLYIREGQFVVKSHYTSIHVSSDRYPDTHHTKGHPVENPEGKHDGMHHLSVAGKDAVMVIDGTNGTAKTTTNSHHWTWNVPIEYTASYVSEAVEDGAHVAIGGVNGNGTLIVENNAYFSNAGGWSTHIGYSGELDEKDYEKLGCHVQHATTATTSGKYENIEDRYIGNYTPGSVDSSKYFGKGEVYVRNNSYIHFGGGSKHPGYANGGGIYMGEAILSIENSSKGEAGDSYFGTYSGALSEIKIAKDSELNLTRNLSTGYEKNKIPVEDAKIVIDVDDKSTLSVANQANISTNNNNTTTTVLTLTNDSVAKFGSLTAGSESGNSTAEINIDSTSSVEAYDSTKGLQVTINHADVNNAGAIKAKTIAVNNGGTLSMIGKDAKLNDNSEVTVNAGGTLQADGGELIALNAEKVTVKEGGAISLKNGSTLSAKALTMAAGSTIRLSGNYSSGDKLVSSAALTMADDVTVTMDNGQVNYTIEDGVVYLTAVFDNSIAEALTVTNWGIATASRTFVNAVRSQRTNTGCIANGRGTAWAAV